MEQFIDAKYQALGKIEKNRNIKNLQHVEDNWYGWTSIPFRT